jgi:hypothetical protein
MIHYAFYFTMILKLKKNNLKYFYDKYIKNLNIRIKIK